MPGTTSGSPKARVLGAWLRQRRETAELGVRELAEKLEISHANLSRWETGDRLPQPEDVAMVLTALGVNGEQRDRLLNLTRAAREPNWLTLGEPGASDALSALIEFEQTAHRVTDWSPSGITGLLQTGDYARAIMTGAGGPPTQERDKRVRVRLSRRDVLSRQNPVTLSAIIGEEALRQIIGSPEIMADQLRKLLEFAEWPTVTLQVMPTGHGWHPGIPGPFYLLEFDTFRPIVHLEHLRSSLFLYEEHEDLQAYVEAAHTLRDLALTPDDSAELIKNTINTLEKT